MRLKPENTLAICIDYQEKLMPAINDKDEVLRKTEILVKGLRALGVPILVTQQYTKGLGETVEPIKEALGDFEYLDKTEFDGMANEAICAAVKAANRENVIVFGAETHICALQTAIGVKEAGYNAMMIDDCCGSRTQSDKDSGLRRAVCEGISVSCCETVLFELVGKAVGDGFKTVSKLVK